MLRRLIVTIFASENNKIELMKQLILLVLSFLTSVAFVSCDFRQNPNTRTYEQSYESSSTATADGDEQYVNQSLSNGQTPYTTTQEKWVEDDPYYNNSLGNGNSPYLQSNLYAQDESQITVSTSIDSKCDLVVIVKRNGNMVANTYLQAGGEYTFNLPNGRYQVFFYAGKGWNPNKQMPNGLRGGFVANESYSKDSPVTLQYQGVTYSLIPQPNGNFDTQQSNASEVF